MSSKDELGFEKETVEVLGEQLDRALEALQAIEDLTTGSYNQSPELLVALIRNELRFYHIAVRTGVEVGGRP